MQLKNQIVALIALALVSLGAHAVTVSTIYLDDLPDNNHRVLTLTNESPVTQYIRVEISKWDGAQQIPIDTSSPRVVVATPSTVTLLPAQKRSIRVTPLFEREEKEHQFIVNVKPVISPKEAALNKVKAVAAYGVRFLYRPLDPVVDFEFKRSADGIELVNSGNTSVLVLGAVACPDKKANPSDCEPLKAGRVAPNSAKLVSSTPAMNQTLVVGEYQVAGKISEKRTDSVGE